MKTWTIVLQTDLPKEILYDELVNLKKKLKVFGFYIEGFDIEEAPQ